jgi:hypothetical protein
MTKAALSMILAGFLLALSFTSPASAQVLYGTLVGEITDQTGAVVPAATVTVTHTSTGQTREATTGTAGRFTIGNLLPGAYDLKVTKEGFSTMTQTGIEVEVNNVSRADLTLQVGQATQQVTVQADATMLQTERADVSAVVGTKPIATLPLNQYRNYQALINLVPGATPGAFQNNATDTPGRALTTNINGTARNQNMTRVDGAINVNVWLPHHTMYTPPSETIETVNIATGSFDAEQGMAGGAAITVVTKSGTNDLHGAAWEFHNNQRMRSRNYFMPPTSDKPLDVVNIFGGTLGGPIVKNRLFYFGGYEGTRQRTGASGLFTVPTAAQRAGDFSGNISANGQGRLYDPATGSANGAGRTPFPNNMIPPGRISPVARRILEYVPLPNLAGDTQNYFASGTGVLNRDNYDIKVNWNRNERHSIFFKYSRMDASVVGRGSFGQLIGTQIGTAAAATGDTVVQVPTIGHTWTLSPTVILDQNLGFTRMVQTVFGEDYGRNWGTEVFGIPGTNVPEDRYSGLPAFSFSTYSPYGQTATWIPMWRTDGSYTHNTNITWSRGAHELRFGFDLVRHGLNHWQPENANPRGNFTFGGGVTALRGGAAPNQYNSYAGFLLGLPTEVNKSLQYITLSGREWQFGWFVRDRWQVTRRLTLNLGFRYEYYPLMTRANSGIERLELDTMRLVIGGFGSVPTNPGIGVSKTLFAPRLGVAWRATDSTVLRTGYGLTYDPLPLSRPLRGTFPFTIASIFVGPDEFQPFRPIEQGIPSFTGPDLSTGVVDLPPTIDVRAPGSYINRGYIQSWNFTLEHKLPWDFVGSAGYVGTQTTHQFAELDVNAAAPGAGNAGRPQAARFNRRIRTRFWDGMASSSYHSLQTTLNRRFSGGLFVKGAYTWGKALNMTDDAGGAFEWNWPGIFRRNYGLANYDRTHTLQIAWAWEPPIGRGRRWMNTGLGSWIIGNWSLNGVFYHFSGNPFNVTASGTSLNAPGNTQTADQVKPEVEKIGGIGPGQKYFDPTAFAAVSEVRFGNTGRNILRGPGVTGLDGSVFRIFPITEQFRLEFRAEAFNVTNTPRFANPSSSVTGGNFMEVRSTRDDSDRQFRLGLKLSF